MNRPGALSFLLLLTKSQFLAVKFSPFGWPPRWLQPETPAPKKDTGALKCPGSSSAASRF
jgi:hypothetical protein